MELTLLELADRVGMTPRNIREWQTVGVLPAPSRRGRVAVYDGGHIARIERVKSLRADGFPLDVIRQFLDRSEESAADIRAVTSALLDPAGDGGTAVVAGVELTDRLGRAGVEQLASIDLIETLDGGQILVKDVVTVDYVERLVAIGLPVAAVISALETMTQRQVDGVNALVDVYGDAIWKPFVDAGLPTDQWHSIAETSSQMRELVIGLGGQSLRRATDIVIGQIAVQQANKLRSDQ